MPTSHPSTPHSRNQSQTLNYTLTHSTLGLVLIATSENGICCLTLGDDPEFLIADLKNRSLNCTIIERKNDALVSAVIDFIEHPQADSNFPLDLRGTAFQKSVWHALKKIPFGTSSSYSEIAHKIGRPRATRAVANACAANSIAVIIPCHRVLKRDGGLSGYRWGIERKRALLERERSSLQT